jgi:hypothetical protein
MISGNFYPVINTAYMTYGDFQFTVLPLLLPSLHKVTMGRGLRGKGDGRRGRSEGMGRGEGKRSQI